VLIVGSPDARAARWRDHRRTRVGCVIWWLVIVLLAGSLLILAMAAVPLLRRLGELGIAARRLGLRAADAQRLVPAVTALRQRAEQMQQELSVVQERAARTQHGRQSTGRLTKLSDS
jgi:hypothetical protein